MNISNPNLPHIPTDIENLQDIKRHIQSGHLQLARLDQNNQPIKMQFKQLQQKTHSLNKHQKIYKLIEGLSYEEKYQWTNIRRLKANRLFKQGEIDKAIQIYLQALIGVATKNHSKSPKNTSITDSNTFKQEQLQQNKQFSSLLYQFQQLSSLKIQLQYPILMNIATCFYKKKQYQQGIYICDRIINDKEKVIEKHLQAMYKKAYFLYQLNQFEKSKQILKQIGEIMRKYCQNSNKNYDNSKNDKIYGLNKVNMKDLKQLQSKIRQKNKQQKNVYKKIFDQQSSDQQQNQQKKSTLNNSSEQQQYDVLIYQQGYIKRTIIFIKQLITSCCQRSQYKINKQKDQEENKLLKQP